MLKYNGILASTASILALTLAACGDGDDVTMAEREAAGNQQEQTTEPAGEGDGIGGVPPQATGPELAEHGVIDSPAANAPVEDFGEPRGRADFEFAGGTMGSGTAWFFDAPQGVRIHVMTRDMQAGTHAIHVHETGDCSAPDFTSAGDHLGVDAGMALPDKPDDFEAGMLPDITIGDDGAGGLNAVLEVVTFDEDTERTWPLFDEDGSAVVIHRFATGELPAGEDNPRIACAEIYPSDL